MTFSDDFEGAARTVTGNGLDNIILTQEANDTVDGRGGDDEIRTGDGNDFLWAARAMTRSTAARRRHDRGRQRR